MDELKYGISVLFEGGGSVQFGATRLPDKAEPIDAWIDKQVENAIAEDRGTGVLFVRGGRVDCLIFQKVPDESEEQLVPQTEPQNGRRGLYVPNG